MGSRKEKESTHGRQDNTDSIMGTLKIILLVDRVL